MSSHKSQFGLRIFLASHLTILRLPELTSSGEVIQVKIISADEED